MVACRPAQLCRVSTHKTGEPYFGRSGAHRFDDPAKSPAGFGTCYLGENLMVAFAESMLHDARPKGGVFSVPTTDLTRAYAHSFDGPALKLADFTGPSLRVLDCTGEISGTSDYLLTQQWAVAVVGHPAGVDGFKFMSRHITNGYAVVLFERDRTKPLALKLVKPLVPLAAHRDYLTTMRALRVNL
jgi:hypothetical protein